MGKSVFVLALLLAAVAGAVYLLARRPPSPASETATERTGEAPSDAPSAAPRLAGRAPEDPGDDGAPPAPIAPLIAALADEAASVEAAARLRARLRTDDLTLDELLDLALLPADGGLGDRLRAQALDRLAERGSTTLPLLGRLFDVLQRGSDHEREIAAQVISIVGGRNLSYLLAAAASGNDTPHDREDLLPFLPRIRALVEDEDADLDARLAMLPLLDALGADAVETADALIRWIQEIHRSRAEFRRQNPFLHASYHHYEFRIQETLSGLGPGALPAILAVLREEDPVGEYELELAIREMGDEALEALAELVSDPDPDLRANALIAIAENTKGGAETLALLRRALCDPSSTVRQAAVGHLGAYGAEAGSDLLAALSDRDGAVRTAAARVLAELPEAAASALPRLLELVRTGSYGEQLSAAGTLAKLGAVASDAAPLVLDRLADEMESEYFEQVLVSPFREALEALGPAALPHLLDAARGTDPKRRRAAVEVLRKLEAVAPEDVAPLAGHLHEFEGVDRLRLAGLLAAHGHPAAVAHLVQGLSSEDRALRTAAAEGLQAAGPEASGALGLLVQGLDENDARLHAEGARWGKEWDHYYTYYVAVQKVGAHDPDALVPHLAHENGDVAKAASEGIVGAGKAGLDALDQAWPHVAPQGRALVVQAFRSEGWETMDPRAKELVVRALADPDPRVRFAAARGVRGRGLEQRVIETLVDLLSVAAGKVAQNAAWELRRHRGALAPWEAKLREAQPREASTTREWVQDLLDAIEDAR